MDVKELNQRFHDFANKANSELVVLGSSERIGFNGQCISGNIGQSKTLLLSVNPGGELSNVCKPLGYSPELKYFGEYHDRLRFADIMVSNLCDDKPELMHTLSESYLVTPFPTKDEQAWIKLFSQLTDNLKAEYDDLMGELVKSLLSLKSVKHIVVSGKKNFDQGVRQLENLGLLESSEPEDLVLSKTGEALIRKVTAKNGLPIYGTFHFSLDPNVELRDATRAFFKGKI